MIQIVRIYTDFYRGSSLIIHSSFLLYGLERIFFKNKLQLPDFTTKHQEQRVTLNAMKGMILREEILSEIKDFLP